MSRRPKIAIIHGGIASLAAALALFRDVDAPHAEEAATGYRLT
jgi:hypothetical protein